LHRDLGCKVGVKGRARQPSMLVAHDGSAVHGSALAGRRRGARHELGTAELAATREVSVGPQQTRILRAPAGFTLASLLPGLLGLLVLLAEWPVAEWLVAGWPTAMRRTWLAAAWRQGGREAAAPGQVQPSRLCLPFLLPSPSADRSRHADLRPGDPARQPRAGSCLGYSSQGYLSGVLSRVLSRDFQGKCHATCSARHPSVDGCLKP
jgi:hypothetical protein